ncbi:hypothetical protein RRF57_006567 [Xylaria bambusicola]|uniref:P-type Na(+) transporter n=1 Tax=Xylaria bambusicola TaxID=326684 RepID=A0AAN7ULE2_9PEZI
MSEDKEALASAGKHVSGQSNKPMSRPAHALSYEQVIHELGSDPINGLSSDAAKQRLEELGQNALGDSEGVSPLKIIVAQIANAMTLVLILAMAVSFGIRSWIEGGVITLVILINVIVGFFQEYSAEKTMDSLRSLSSPTACVVRDGNASVIPTSEVVIGDLVELGTGDTVPADLRVVEVAKARSSITEAVNFETDEALLTGESLPVQKNENAVFDDDTGPGDRLNVAFSSSTVTKGRAKGIVFATATYTEIGAIAVALRERSSKVRPVKRNADGTAKPHRYLEAYTLTTTDAIGRFLGVNVGTPLQKKLSRLAVLLFFIAVVFAIVVLAANKFSNRSEVIIYAVATGLSMIPASLVVVLTITMAAGTKSMVTRNVIVRNLKSLEALGAVTDICSDKTGTLTQGKMVAKRAWIPALGTYTVDTSSEPFNPTVGDMMFSDETPSQLKIGKDLSANGDVSEPAELLSKGAYLHVASLANLATVSESNGEWHARGDPTEIAIQVFASRFDRNRLKFTQGNKPEWSQISELPFDSDVKRITIPLTNFPSSPKVPSSVCLESVGTTTQADNTEPVPLSGEFREQILENMTALASMGLRVLALASRKFDGTLEKGDDVDREFIESNLTFQGLIGLYDPPRPESAPAVRSCHEAGISVHMLTGDHPETAKAIAIEVGILPTRMERVRKDVANCMVMTASQFDALSDEKVDELPVLPLVIARCAPSTKVRMIEALHRRKRFCAMTGDGVNDSPSLKRADVGIAMGQAGSDVAKEASDVVLSDDNFASIVAAIEEGRRIFDNIQKFILHVLAENIAQALTLLVGLAFKDRTGLSVFPLAPVEILWIIFRCAGYGSRFRTIRLRYHEPPTKELGDGNLDLEFLIDMFVYGVWVAALCLGSFALVIYRFGGGQLGSGCNEDYNDSCEVVFRARATTFACLTWFALFLAWEMIDRRRSFFRMQPGSKRYLTQWIHDVWRNKFLFWAVAFGFLSLFPIVYIPGLNTIRHYLGVGRCHVASVLFFGGAETWKWTKRVYIRRRDARNHASGGAAWKDLDVEQRVFAEYLEFTLGDNATEAPVEKLQ